MEGWVHLVVHVMERLCCLAISCYFMCRRALSRDRRAEPLAGQRVPYVIVYGTPGLPLIQLVRCPYELLADPSLRINSTYYITRQILPPLGRIFSLLGVDVTRWYSDLPRVTRSVLENLGHDQFVKNRTCTYCLKHRSVRQTYVYWFQNKF